MERWEWSDNNIRNDDKNPDGYNAGLWGVEGPLKFSPPCFSATELAKHSL
jgi:hypothetical protein